MELLAQTPSLDIPSASIAGANLIGLGLIAWLVKHWQTKTFPDMAKAHREDMAILLDSFKGELMHQRNARAGEIERFLQELKDERTARRETDAAMQSVLRDLTKEIHSLPDRLRHPDRIPKV